ncbi:hypothetical protein SEA_BOOMERJR_35 [Streptomyces phage BoomerJR]|uniref:Ferritin/DPS domain-containing protein n=2 Tax=Streptomyces virus Yaboi TaxID=2846408 RepID=A0A411C496_9CAUD|nr:hypothetical protein SEA_GENIE2_35 [Streptomyces phage Genie2]QAY12687.1 hypothetical protein SEA_BOOMERJR_35 [Streptomyces phage BoomerJR]UVD39883.1 hypothetical protein SEA_STANIMAL_35 [Streptomyces phage Stanimal]
MLEQKLEEILEWLLILSLATKENHWNLRGKEFFYLHEKLDEFHEDITEYADTVAERARAREMYLAPKVSYEFSGESVSYLQVVNGIKSSLESLTMVLSGAIFNITDDLATQDVLIEIKRGVDKWLWMFTESAR